MSALHIFGGSRGTGQQLALHAARNGWSVTTYARTHSPELAESGVRQVELDALNEQAVAHATASIPSDSCIISTLGASGGHDADYHANRYLIQSLEATSQGVRFILVTSLGCGDSRAHASPRLLEAIGDVLDSKTRAENVLQKTAFAWTIIRPGQLIDGQVTGTAILAPDPRLHGKITRAELARIIAHILEQEGAHRKIYTAVDPGLA